MAFGASQLLPILFSFCEKGGANIFIITTARRVRGRVARSDDKALDCLVEGETDIRACREIKIFY